MKGIHISLTFALLVFVTAGAWAQTRSDRRTVQIQDFELIQDTDGQVSIDFTLVIGDKAAGRANTLSVIPMLTNGSIGRPLWWSGAGELKYFINAVL